MSQVKVKFGAEDSGLEATLNKLNNALDNIDKNAKQATDQVDTGFGKMAAAGAIAGGAMAVASKAMDMLGASLRAAFGYMKTAVDDASNLGETISKVGVIFGTGAGEIERWSKTSAESLGQSQKTAMDAAATFGVFGKSAGLSGQQLTGFSKGMVQLSADMASFSNSTPEEAILAIGSALRGESEPIRRFGVLLDDATLRNRALKMGLIETTKDALTPQQKVLAAHAEILAQTADAQGDFERTSGGMANQSRILSANLENISAELGQSLLPLVVQVTKAFNDNGVPALKDFVSSMKEIDFDGLGKKLADALKLIPDGTIWDVFALKASAAILDIGAELSAMLQNAVLPQVDKITVPLGKKAFGAFSGMFLSDEEKAKAQPWIDAGMPLSARETVKADKSLGDEFRAEADYLMNQKNREIANRKQAEIESRLGMEDLMTPDVSTSTTKLPGWLKYDEKEAKEKKLLGLKREGLELETKISEAIANGNLAETTRLEAQKKFNEVRQKAIDAGKGEAEANEIAERARLAFIETRENKEQAAHEARMSRLKKELTLSEKIAKEINDAAKLDAIDKGGKLQAKIKDAIDGGNFKKADELNRRLKIAEDEAALRGGGRDRDNRNMRDIAKAAGIDTFGKSNDELRNEVLKKHRDLMNPKDKGLTKKEVAEKAAADKPQKADPVDSLTKLVKDIYNVVAKIEPKLPQHALN